MPAGGYFGRALVVDVTDGTSTTLPLPEEPGITPDAISGYAREEPTHLAVAAAIAAGRGDACLGITAAARAFGLGGYSAKEMGRRLR